MIAEGHVADGVRGVGAEENSDLVFFFEIDQLRSDFFQFGSNAGDFVVGAIWFEVVREDAFPVGLLTVVQRMPVPIFDHVGAGS